MSHTVWVMRYESYLLHQVWPSSSLTLFKYLWRALLAKLLHMPWRLEGNPAHSPSAKSHHWSMIPGFVLTISWYASAKFWIFFWNFFFRLGHRSRTGPHWSALVPHWSRTGPFPYPADRDWPCYTNLTKQSVQSFCALGAWAFKSPRRAKLKIFIFGFFYFYRIFL